MAKKMSKPAAGATTSRAATKGAWTGLLALGTVSVGDTKVAIAACASRQALKLAQADALLVGARLQVSLEADAGQEELFPGLDVLPRLTSVADVHRISVSAEDVSFRLTFRRSDVALGQLTSFAGKAGIAAALTRVGEAGEGVDEEGDDAGNDEAVAPLGSARDRPADLSVHTGGKSAAAAASGG